MAELIAQGSNFENRWRRRLGNQSQVVIGRACEGLSVPWDGQISRRHALLELRDKTLFVEKVSSAGNPVFFLGSETEKFSLEAGEHFVIGETTFTFTVNQALATIDAPNPIQQQTFSHQFLKKVRYRDADRRISVINRLPDVIASAANEEDLLTKMVNTLLAGISSASTVGILKFHGSENRTEVVHWDRRKLGGGDFEASQRLIGQCVGGDETVLHFWDKTTRDLSSDAQSQYTFDRSNDWAFACPLDDMDLADERWVIYVTGRNMMSSKVEPSLKPVVDFDASASEGDLEGDIKFCELIASTLCNLLQLRKLERRHSSLRRFFSPAVLNAFTHEDPEVVLQPRQCRVSVLFCDLRGFSKTSEALSNNLLTLLAMVSQSLGVMTRVILDQGGVIGDFHGDAAMGFWGWPIDQPDGAVKAVAAAIEIQKQIKQMAADHAGDVMRMGIGVGTGEAVAGRIGTDDQVKVTAFGPVVNVASRLEGMTKQLGCSILIDEATAMELQENLETKSAFSVPGPIPLASIRPYSMDKAVNVFRINEPDRGDTLTPDQIKIAKSAVVAFGSGDWAEAKRQLAGLPDADPTKRLLMNGMGENASPPENFDGSIAMQQK